MSDNGGTTTTTLQNSSSSNNNNKLKPASTIQNGWFTERNTCWPGQRFSLAMQGFKNSNNEAILFHQHYEFQKILVFQSVQYGTVLVLDGVIRLTERDEFAYHEMMGTCAALFA